MTCSNNTDFDAQGMDGLHILNITNYINVRDSEITVWYRNAYDNVPQGKGKVTFSLCLSKHHAKNKYEGVEI